MHQSRLFALLLLVLLSIRDLPAATNRWDRDIERFEAAEQTAPVPQKGILFIGSSSIRLWKSLATDFPGLPVINRGFGGSEISDSIHHFDRIVTPCHPRTVVLYAGGNDIHAGKSAEQVFADFKTFAGLVRKNLPRTRLYYISIAPNPARWGEIDRVREANRLIQAWIKTQRRMEFVDAFTAMLGPDGQPRPDIYLDDRLHMNSNGYAIWTRLLRPRLR